MLQSQIISEIWLQWRSYLHSNYESACSSCQFYGNEKEKKIAHFEKIVDQIRGVFKLGGRFGGPPNKVPPGGEGLFPESVPTRFETVATPLVGR